jgi:Flp pilus assembly protein TadG
MDWSSIRRRFALVGRALARRPEGAAAVEFAVIVPVIGVMLAGTIDLAQLSNAGLNLDGALRVGASYAVNSPTNTAAITSAIQGYAACGAGQTSANGCFPAGQPVVTFLNQGAYAPAQPQYCTCDGDSSSSGTITCNNDTTSGGALCATGPKHYYVRIQAVWSGRTWLLPVTGVALPTACGSANSICRTLTVRVL